jgi:predicted SnoaL-like aldol condensation-catalyzing enzyme
MNRSIEEENKELVLKAFDTLFNKRDYKAAERFWSPDYIQHSAPITPGLRRSLQSHQEHPTKVEVRPRSDRG